MCVGNNAAYKANHTMSRAWEGGVMSQKALPKVGERERDARHMSPWQVAASSLPTTNLGQGAFSLSNQLYGESPFLNSIPGGFCLCISGILLHDGGNRLLPPLLSRAYRLGCLPCACLGVVGYFCGCSSGVFRHVWHVPSSYIKARPNHSAHMLYASSLLSLV